MKKHEHKVNLESIQKKLMRYFHWDLANIMIRQNYYVIGGLLLMRLYYKKQMRLLRFMCKHILYTLYCCKQLLGLPLYSLSCANSIDQDKKVCR